MLRSRRRVVPLLYRNTDGRAVGRFRFGDFIDLGCRLVGFRSVAVGFAVCRRYPYRERDWCEAETLGAFQLGCRHVDGIADRDGVALGRHFGWPLSGWFRASSDEVGKKEAGGKGACV